MKLTLFTLILSLLPWAQANRSEVRVAEQSTVRVGDPIRLGTLLAGPIVDLELEEKIHDLVVFEPMNSEGEKKFQSDELALVLRQKLTFHDLKRLSVKIPEQFTVVAKRNFLYEADLKRDISRAATEVCGDCWIELDELNIPEIQLRQEVLQTRLDTQSLKKAGNFLLPLTMTTSQGKSVYWLTGKVSFYKMAPVAKRLIRSNEAIALSDFELRKVDISFTKDGVPSAEDLVGKVAARTFAVGQPIFAGDLKKEMAALRGQPVKILVGGETFEVQTNGVAEESGGIGDMIRVKSADTQKILSGVLIEKATVKVQ